MDEKEMQQQAQAATDKAVVAEKQRMADLKAAFPKDPAFAIESFEKGHSVVEAKAAYHDRSEAERVKTGARPLPTGESREVETTDDFMTMAGELAEKKGISRTEAMRRVARTNPEAHQRFLESESNRQVLTGGGGKCQRIVFKH